MRAPGHPQNCVLTECPLDDLAARLGIDPLKMRLKNLPADNKKAIYEKEIEIATKLAEWDKKWHPPGKGRRCCKARHRHGTTYLGWSGISQQRH